MARPTRWATPMSAPSPRRRLPSVRSTGAPRYMPPRPAAARLSKTWSREAERTRDHATAGRSVWARCHTSGWLLLHKPCFVLVPGSRYTARLRRLRRVARQLLVAEGIGPCPPDECRHSGASPTTSSSRSRNGACATLIFTRALGRSNHSTRSISGNSWILARQSRRIVGPTRSPVQAPSRSHHRPLAEHAQDEDQGP